ncbi:LysR family transcriptional regulator [Neomesorhizobium albiziae]|uniref:LysR family transcriptional regulator n=1 Tax=Neomesorhizobium albiziae TaxID=335020 RepID=UPI001FCEDC99|nr:LysR substrate-binding domain-containing protein [Mesorhizobium albiziae]
MRCFVAVADTGSFTLAGDIVGRTQSAVSQRVKRLEDLVQRQLFLRDSRALSLTREGELMLDHARQMLIFNDATVRTFAPRDAQTRVRLGIADDFIPHHLVALLEEFRRRHPGLEVDVQTGMSCGLNRAFDAGEIDLVFAKKDGEAQRGRVIWREPLCWIAGENFSFEAGDALPLVLLPPPCVYRAVAMDTLNKSGRAFRITCTAESIMGVQAAVECGLGITVLGRSFARSGLVSLSAPECLPILPYTEITMLGEERVSAQVVHTLVEFLRGAMQRNSSAVQPVEA